MRRAILLLQMAVAAGAQPAAKELFEARVRPVLAGRCYSCHGAEQQLSGLRVDSREALLKGGKRGAAVVAGDPAQSVLLKALRHEAGLAMPMGGNKLRDAEIAAVEQWIREGAVWPVTVKAGPQPYDWYERAAKTHWSFQPVKEVAPPAGSGHEVDRFVRATLRAKGLTPAAQADRLTLIRRASFVLTGLPPPREAVDAFVRDRSAEAWPRAVDKLLASPHFGEQWARHWMDVMRYGETRGYEWNYEVIGAWRYRDYLIRAMNADVPYDQLVREHIAGDLLEKPRVAAGVNESAIGTAFFRLGEAGHDDCIKFREISLDVVDGQIDTLGKAFQGLTLSCARCHNHKLDPIPTADYYGLFGILNSSRTMTRTLDVPAPPPAAMVELKANIRAEMARQWMAQTVTMSAKKASFDDPLFPWLAMRVTEPGEFARVWTELAALYRREGETRAAFNRERFTPYADFARGAGSWFADGLGLAAGASASGEFAVGLEGDAVVAAVLPAGLHTNTISTKWNGALRSPLLPKSKKYLSVRVMGGQLAARRTVLDNCAIGEGYRILENASPAWLRLDTISGEKLPAFAEIITKSDNPRIPDRPGMLKSTAAELASPRSYFGAMRAVLHDSPETPREELGHMTRLFEGGAVASLDELQQRYREVARAAVRAWAAGRASDDDVRWIDALLRAGVLDARKEQSAELARLVDEYRRLEAGLTAPRVVDGLGDAGEGFDTPVLIAGNPAAPSEAANPRRFLSKFGNHTAAFATRGSGRRELAETIASRENPLTVRVMVNRIWHHVFGRGIVPTVDNFGREGERPSHPELLDYLAGRFVREGWSIKKMARLLVTSATFRQSGETTAAARETDPQNALLHHYSLRRLPAESVRDAILATSQRLDPAMFGPSIAPARAEPQDYRRLFHGPLDGAGRRSVYTQITRMEGPRFLEIFDYPNPMAARGARDITNVPSQALAMLNDPFVLGQAEVWAKAVVGDGAGSAGERVGRMVESALGRAATGTERERFSGLAAELASLRGVSREAMLADVRVWRDVAHAIFNLKEFLYLR